MIRAGRTGWPAPATCPARSGTGRVSSSHLKTLLNRSNCLQRYPSNNTCPCCSSVKTGLHVRRIGRKLCGNCLWRNALWRARHPSAGGNRSRETGSVEAGTGQQRPGLWSGTARSALRRSGQVCVGSGERNTSSEPDGLTPRGTKAHERRQPAGRRHPHPGAGHHTSAPRSRNLTRQATAPSGHHQSEMPGPPDR